MGEVAVRQYANEWAAQVVYASLEMNGAQVDYDERLHPWPPTLHLDVMAELGRVHEKLRRAAKETP